MNLTEWILGKCVPKRHLVQKIINNPCLNLVFITNRSGCEMKALEGLINVFDDYDRHEFDDCMALEVHAMKEHVFSILSMYRNFVFLILYLLLGST